MGLPYKHIATCDFETFFDKDYTLKKLFMTDYIQDDRFEALTCAIKMDDQPAEVHAGYDEILRALKSIDWNETAFLGHHTQFDGLISTHRFGVFPCFWLDTLSMARAVLGTDVALSLLAVCARFGRTAKVHKQALEDVQGYRLHDLSPEAQLALCTYNKDDVEDTAWLFAKLVGFVPEDELRVIDITLRMYTEPVLVINNDRVRRLYEAETQRKRALFESAGIEVSELSSSAKFAAHLERFGVSPPRKISMRTQKETWAFSKTDLPFTALLHHEDPCVRALVEARLAAKSTLIQTRSQTFIRRSQFPVPIYLNYWGARTGRWSGGDGANFQNLPRSGLGYEMRKALCAPEGSTLIVSDASQIEARTLAWTAGQEDVLATFAAGADVYSHTATRIYGYEVTDETHPGERFVAKTLVLGCGYGAGGRKVNHMMEVGQFGPPLLQPLEETFNLVYSWRGTNCFIVAYWEQCKNNAITAFMNRQVVDDGLIRFEGTERGGYIHLPNGTWIFYPNISWDDQENQMVYLTTKGPVRLWHGIIVENIVQALARIILAGQLIIMEDEMPDMRIATTTHDEVIEVVPLAKVDDYTLRTHQIMSQPPGWAKGLPLNAKTYATPIYEKR